VIALFIVITIVIITVVMYHLFFSPTSQYFGETNYSFKSEGKQIALTFDDGPNEPYTSQLLKILKRHQVHSTFFCCGACISRYPEMLCKIIEDGHILGNHSHDHNLLHYLKPKKYIEEVKKTNKLIHSITGITPSLYRSPWLFRTPSLLASVKSLSMLPIWGIFGSELEVFQPSAESMAKRAFSLAKPGAILIFHDGRESRGGNRQQTIDAINLLIPLLKKEGYTFVQVSKQLFSK
jgi:peptidoglycan/xylan/chitin deacetylase (PgdA/CDA1 family)